MLVGERTELAGVLSAWPGSLRMSETRVLTEGIDEEGVRLNACLMMVDNAVIAFFDEERSRKLGTLAVALPQHEASARISSVLLGERNVLITRILAERLSRVFNKIALVSTHLEEIKEARVNSILISLSQRLFEKADRGEWFE